MQADTGGRFAAALGFVLLLAATSALARDRTDIVMLDNGDHLTGEIIQLEHGQLELKTDALGTVYIEWPRVSGLSSSVVFMVENLGGHDEFGRLAGGNGHLTIDDDGRLTDLPLGDVARLGPVRESFLARVRGSTSVGVNYAQANNVKVGSFRFDAEYRGRNTLASLSSSVDTTSSRNSNTNQRILIDYSERFFLEGTRFWAVLGSFERNPELGVDGRPQAGIAIGESLRRRSESDLVAYVGLGANYESVDASGDNRANILGIAGLDWRIYRFSIPETTLTSSLKVFPYLSDFGRVRARVDVTLQRKFTRALSLNLSLYDDYDSRPPGLDVVNNDYGIVTSIGYTF
ncbi:MAG TPA: DUF481 domain-containing protein [Steroidobacteraceae bacterium]|jgi:hypothetical protein|nr:DUF481 domain-containing protein [Steroidobacteraceae bacterium]